MLLKTTEEIESPSINLTSMIDVLFLLIIFFMVGTRFNESERQINVNLPRANGASAMIQGPKSRVVTIARDGTVALDGMPTSIQQLSSDLRHAAGQYRDIAVDVRGDATASFQRFAEVADAISNAGVTNLRIATAQNHMPNRR